MEVPLLDLRGQYRSIREEIRQAMDEVCESQHFILGPKVEKLEEEIAAYSGAFGGCGVTSGSDALLLCLMVEGIGAGDEIITTPYTFFATIGAIDRVGAKPVFVDIDPGTFNLDPAQVEKKISPRTKAIMPVHLFGQMADMDPLMALARKHNLIVIEDAAQAIGAEYQGRRAGSIGHYGCFSFFPSKNLGCFGDGGMVVTDNAARLDRLKLFRSHGSRPKYYHHCVGGNFRLDALQAAILSVKLKYLDLWTLARQNNAREYEHLFTSRHLTSRVTLPKAVAATSRHIYNQYCIRVAADKRQAVLDGLKDAHIGCEVYYPVPMHLQPCFAKFGYREGEFPESERAARESLALPIYPETTREQRHYIVETLKLLVK